MTSFSERAVEAAARASCRWTWERNLPAEAIDQYVDGHWKEHVAGVRVALTAALAVDGPALQGWRTIDSAPKDGTCILLCAIDDTFHEVCTGWWDSEWRDYGDIGCNGQCDYHPTHWQPLPAPPLTAASDGEVG